VIGAVRKGVADGKKHLVKVPLTRTSSVPTESRGRDGVRSARFLNWRASRTFWPSDLDPRRP
jgi:ribosomal protein S5